MQEQFQQFVLFFQTNLGTIIFCTCLLGTIAGVLMALTKRAIFYADYKDLKLCALMTGGPAVILAISSKWLLVYPRPILLVTGLLFIALLGKVAVETWRANRSVFKLVIILIAKITLSFLYVVHFFDALTAEKRSKRGVSWFILLLLLPLVYALVHDKSGAKVRLPSGRGRF